jgi:uncharacterized protein (DUF4415 family)
MNKEYIREDVVEEVYMKLEDVMDWYKSGGDGEWKGKWNEIEMREIIKRFLG